MKRAIAEGFDSIELAKRYTTVTMGPCQGRLLPPRLDPAVRARAGHRRGGDRHDDGAAAVDARLARPARRPPARAREAHGAPSPPRRGGGRDRSGRAPGSGRTTTATRRPRRSDVHEAVGVIDVSTLGKLLVTGPDAAAFLERLYPNRFGDLADRAASATACSPPTPAGSWTTARSPGSATSSSTSRPPRPAPTACSAGSSGGTRSGGWTSRSSTSPARSPRSTSPGRARASCSPGSPTPTSPTTRSATSTRASSPSPACPCLLLRIGFVGELGYELHFPSTARRAPLGRARRARARRPFGLEAQRILRLEKQHIIVGQDTDSESNVLDANMAWLVKARQGRLRREVGARAHAGARTAGAARRLRDGEGRRSRAEGARSCAPAGPPGA